LEEHYPERPVLPGSSRSRATARRIVSEASCYLYPSLRGVMPLFLQDYSLVIKQVCQLTSATSRDSRVLRHGNYFLLCFRFHLRLVRLVCA
jgi:hypothetical protein